MKRQYLHEKHQDIPPHCDHATKCEDGSRKGEFCYQNFEISMREEVRCDVVELKDLLRRKNIEMQKIKYQSCLTNPYCWPVTRDLVKSTLEAMFENKLSIEDELAKRELDMSLNDQAIDKKS